MDEFCGIFLLFFQYSLGGMGGEVEQCEMGGVGGGKKSWLEHPRSNHDIHTMAHATTEAVGTILGPQHLISAINGCHCFSCDFSGSEKFPP